MGQVVLLVKLCIPLISLLGIAEFLSLKKNIPLSFSIPLTVCAVMFLLNVGGYINFLPQISVLIYIFGWVMAFYVIITKIRERVLLKYLLSYMHIYVVLGCALVILFCKDFTFVHPDEYNHWGIIVKELITVDGFPDSRTIISCREYTLSTALFSYFFLNVTGYSESLIYITHGFMYIMGLSFLLKGTEKRDIISMFMAISAIIVVIWAFPNSFQYLLVEFAVAIFGAFLIILAIEITQKNELDIEKVFVYTTPTAIAICFIKSSAYAYWIAFIIILFIYFLKTRKEEIVGYDNNKKLKILFFSVSPITALLLWNQNVSKLYANEQAYKETKFALSPIKMMEEAKEKGADKIIDILKDLFLSLFNSPMANIAIVFIVILLVIAYFNKNEKQYKLFAVTGVLSWVIYYIGYGISLIFLFPKWEMEAHQTNLLAYDRYFSTATGVVVILCMYSLISALKQCGKKQLKAVYVMISILSVAIMYTIGFPNEMFYRGGFDEKTLEEISVLKDESAQIPREYERYDRVLCYTGEYVDATSAFNNFFLTIEMLNNNVSNFSNYTVEGNEISSIRIAYYVSQNDYIAVLRPSQKMFEILATAEIYADYEDGRLYKITPLDDGGYTLIKVG